MIRVGFGIDVHKFVEGRDLWIGGVKIPYEYGLAGHSDADVLIHAICDALLGALALGDIGKLFPDNDDRFLGADSILLAKEVFKHISAMGWRVGNIDATVIAQAPKLAPHIDTMRENLAKTLGVSKDRVGVKATTEEKLGFTGEKLGISAHAVLFRN